MEPAPDPHSRHSGCRPDFYVAGGNVPPDAACYVERQADRELLETLAGGGTCHLLDTRQVGKSSLMSRAGARLRAQGARVATVDLTAIGWNVTPRQWYAGVAEQAGASIDEETSAEDAFRSNDAISPVRALFRLLENWVENNPRPLVLLIDEIDAVRSLPFPTDEFFAGIRALHNARAERPHLARLGICMAGSTTPESLIRDPRTTPFNIGRRIEPTDFTPLEAEPLAQGLGDGGRHLLDRILHWTGGHPYLTQVLCRETAMQQVGRPTHVDVDRTADRLFFADTAVDTEPNLNFVANRMLDGPRRKTLDLYEWVLRGRVSAEQDGDAADTLRLSGIVRVQDGRLAVRNRIYERVFGRTWLEHHLPASERQWQRALFRRTVLRIAAAVLLVAVGAIWLGVRIRTTEARVDRLSRENKELLKALADEHNQTSQEAERALAAELRVRNLLEQMDALRRAGATRRP
ncbi:MAG: AAA-like domain-containing protein [Armatimonadota bacterium]